MYPYLLNICVSVYMNIHTCIRTYIYKFMSPLTVAVARLVYPPTRTRISLFLLLPFLGRRAVSLHKRANKTATNLLKQFLQNHCVCGLFS